MELSYRTYDLMLDDNQLSEYLKISTAFHMKFKKSKRKLQKLIKYHPESSVPIEIRRNVRPNDGVKLRKTVLRKFIGDPLDWKSFKETFKAAVHSSDRFSNIEKLPIWKRILTNQRYKQLKGFPWWMKITQLHGQIW